MNREVITDKQGISTLVLFLCGSTLIFDTAVEAKEDIWLAIIIAFIIAFAVVMLYARVLSLFPGIMPVAHGALHTLVLNAQGMDRTFFPSYRAYKLIDIRNFFNRIEIVIGATLIICGFVKITVALISSCKGICWIFALDDYKVIATPVCIIATIIATPNFRGVLEMVEWVNSIWNWYALFFQIILFLIIYIGAEIKGRKRNRC